MIDVLEVPFKDPCDVFLALPLDIKDLVFCDGGDVRGRYSYIAFNAMGRLSLGHNGIVSQCGFGAESRVVAGDFFDVLGDEIARIEVQFPTLLHDENIPPFRGGCFFALGYDKGEGSGAVTLPCLDYASATAFFYDVVVSFDLLAKRAWLMTLPYDDRAEERAKIKEILMPLLQGHAVKDGGSACEGDFNFVWHAQHDVTSYKEAVSRVREHILDGDIFQANLSQKFNAVCPHFETYEAERHFLRCCYRALRYSNPAPYSCFMDIGDVCLLSSSPECFVKGDHHHVWTDPIKGTCLSQQDKNKDDKAKDALRLDPKNRSENIMIVDLLRNDFSKVCAPESIHVDKLCVVETFKGLHHLVSRVSGDMAHGGRFVDVLRACFPGGSITGAPKIRAMEVIASLEGEGRGYYCGSFGYIGIHGCYDSNILIRTLIYHDHHLSFRVGGGIVLRSDPYEEYVETFIKGNRIFKAFVSDGDCARVFYQDKPIMLEDFI